MDLTNDTPPRTERRDARGIVALLPFAIPLALMVFLYIRALRFWYEEWTLTGSYYAHGVFIPFFFALMIWRNREPLRRLPLGRSWGGLALMLFAMLIVMFAERTESRVTLSFSFILLLIGASLVMAGKAITKTLLFPMLFLFAMIPVLPDNLIQPIAFPIQMTSAKMAATLLNVMQFEAVRTGTSIVMPHYNLDVELACSGFKTLIGLMAFSAAFAYLVEAAAWKRWAIFLLAAPLSIVVNGVRITLIGMVGELFNAQAAHTFHDYSGFIVLIFGFMILFSLAKWFKCEKLLGMALTDPPAAGVESRESRVESPEADAAALDAKYGPPRTGTLPHLYRSLYPVVGLLAGSCLLKPLAQPPGNTIAALRPEQLPRVLADGRWNQMGEARKPAESIQEQLKPETWIDRDYSSDTGAVNLLLTGGNSRHTFHDPHDCFLGSGYVLRDVGMETVDTPVGPVTVQVSEAEQVDEKTHEKSKSLLMFVYVVDGKQLQTTRAVKKAVFWQTIFGGTGRPSYFLRFLQLSSGTDTARREQLKGFIRSVWTLVYPSVIGAPPEKQTAQR